MDLRKQLEQASIKPYLLAARYGIEKEGQRVNLNGKLVTTNHPTMLSKQDLHPYIQRDFAETQIELITPVVKSKTELLEYLSAIHDVVYQSMGQDEMIWPLSMPPMLPENEEDIIIAKLNDPQSFKYRTMLANTYGRRKQMISGIHFNFEFDEELLLRLFESQNQFDHYETFKTEVYMKVTRNYLNARWLISYFYGASPLSEDHFFNEESLTQPVRSIRTSSYGYRNKNVEVSFDSLSSYIMSLSDMVQKGRLTEEKEFYSPIRLRGGQTVADLKQSGIRYIEVRDIDLNPFERNGISYSQLEFLHLFMLYMLYKPEPQSIHDGIKEGMEKSDHVALEHPLAESAYKNEAIFMLNEIEILVATLQLDISPNLLSELKDMIDNPAQTLSGQLYLATQESTQKEVATTLAKQNYDITWNRPYQLNGFTDMELSTQMLMFDAIQKGITLEILDRDEQFLKLSKHDQIEYVKNGNMTSKDTYISSLIMENKTVTKKIIKEAGFKVPEGDEFNNINHAISAYEKFKNKGFVVKPKTTNYGLGISIFKEKASFEDYQKAVEIAFKEDTSILVEEFLIGTEYRFFVLNQKVHAILQRVPANVVGNGKETIEQLVNLKNQDPLRGTDHRTPLEVIALGDIEKLMLKTQGLNITSIPEAGQVVYLRENSNISTGGDSIDVTDEIADDYKKVAIEAVAAIGATISGIDLIIPDIKAPAKQAKSYGIIEANFNPSMYMHIYPYKGKGRRLTAEVLNYLFEN